jgi:hypothetical protein
MNTYTFMNTQFRNSKKNIFTGVQYNSLVKSDTMVFNKISYLNTLGNVLEQIFLCIIEKHTRHSELR